MVLALDLVTWCFVFLVILCFGCSGILGDFVLLVGFVSWVFWGLVACGFGV